MKIITAILTFLLGCCLSPLMAQQHKPKHIVIDFLEGYVVTKSQDTLTGLVSIAPQKNHISFIAFQDEEGRKRTFTANDILAFGQQVQPHNPKQGSNTGKSWVHYESKEHPKKFGQKLFLERLVSGSKISLYMDVLSNEPTTTLIGLKREESEQSYLVHKKGMKPFIIRSKGFQHDAKVLFSDCTEFVAFMQMHADKFRFKHIGFMIEGYNRNCLAQ